jgi:hypothetical protein
MISAASTFRSRPMNKPDTSCPTVVALLVICLLTLIVPDCFAQTPKEQIDLRGQQNQKVLKWQSRVNSLTEEIVSESSAVSDSERAIYFALLAKMWWKVDQTDARNYLKKAADKIISTFESDDRSDLAKKLKYTQRALQIIAELDESLTLTIVGKIDIDDDSKQDNPEMAAMFAKLGIQVVESNPGMAMAAGFDSVSYGVSAELAQLIRDLYVKDPKLGETLYRRALQVATGNYSDANYTFVGTLGSYTFDNRKDRTFSDATRRSYLEMLADLVSGAASVEAERPTRCGIVLLAPPMLVQIDTYLPGQSQTIRQQIQICIPFTRPFTQESTKALISGDEPQTVDDLIRTARDSKDPALKVQYFSRAISKLEQLKKYQEIFSLLDGLEGADLKAMAFAWDDWRVEYAALWAIASFEEKDMPQVYRIIDKTPKRIRPYVRFRLAYKLSPVKDRDFLLENLEAMRTELGSLNVPVKDAASNYLTLATLYLKVQPSESLSVFRDSVKYINKTDNENPDYLWEKDYSPLDNYMKLPSELLDIDEIGMTNALRDISSRRSRVRLKLGLLESSLAKYVEEKKVLEQMDRKPLTTGNDPKITPVPTRP